MLEENPADINYLFHPAYAEILFEAAKRNGSMKKFAYTRGGKQETLEYASLNPDDNWQVPVEYETIFGTPRTINMNLTELIKTATEQQIPSFFVGSYTKTMYFVFSKVVPEKFIPFVLLHELEESKTQGVAESNIMDIAYAMSEDGKHEMAKQYVEDEMESAQKYPHKQASFTELHAVFEKGETFAEEYADWVLKLNSNPDDSSTMFNQAFPGYLTRNNRIQKTPLQNIVEFYCVLGDSWVADEERLYLDKQQKENLSKIWPWIMPYLPE